MAPAYAGRKGGSMHAEIESTVLFSGKIGEFDDLCNGEPRLIQFYFATSSAKAAKASCGPSSG
jgi:hypothetical protein